MANAHNVPRRFFTVGIAGAMVAGCNLNKANSESTSHGRTLERHGDPVSPRRISSYQRDTSVSVDGNYFASCKETQASNDISFLDIKSNTETIFRFEGSVLAYAPAVSPNGKKLAVLLQNKRFENELVILNLHTRSIINRVHFDDCIILLPIFVGEDLLFFKADSADEGVMESRFLTGLTEPRSSGDKFRLYKLSVESASPIQLSDEILVSPQSIRLFGQGLMLNRGVDDFQDEAIDDEMAAGRQLKVVGGVNLFEIADHDNVEIVNCSNSEVYIFDGSIEVFRGEFPEFFDVYSKLNFKKLNYSVRSSGDLDSIGLKISDRRDVFEKYVNVVFVTSSEKVAVFSGLAKDNSGYKYIFTDEYVNIYSENVYTSLNSATVLI